MYMHTIFISEFTIVNFMNHGSAVGGDSRGRGNTRGKYRYLAMYIFRKKSVLRSNIGGYTSSS